VTAVEKQLLWARALTLGERIALVKSGSSSEVPASAEEVAAMTAKWCERCAKGDVEKFRARLAWDEIEEADIARFVRAAPAKTSPEPAWLRHLTEALEIFASKAVPANEELRSSIPFIELWLAFAHASAQSLPTDCWTPEMFEFLARRLSPLGSPIFYARFDKFRSNHTGESDAYEAWLDWARAGGAEQIFAEHPVLARALASLTLSAMDTLRDLRQRFDADFDELRKLIGPGDALPAGEHDSRLQIEPGLSDRHYDGRQVARVRLGQGATLIYKPKSIDLDAAFQQLLARLAAVVPDTFPAPLRSLRRNGYGWVEFVRQDQFTTREEAADYFRRGGGLLALAYALEGRDFIMDNLIATHSGPAAIDCETALQPLCLPGGAEKMDRTRLLEQLLKGRDFSVLDTGLLPLWMPAAGGFYDLSGLGGQAGYVSALRQEAWDGVGTGAMQATMKAVIVEPEKNQVCLGAEVQSATAYAHEIEEGFVAAYRAIMAHRDELLGELAGWGELRLRFLLRTTNTYGQLMKRMLSAETLRSGLAAGVEAEILYRPWVAVGPPPPIVDFLREEVAALQRWDVPCFHLDADGEKHPYFLASPLAMARDRCTRMGDEDLGKQRRVLRSSLVLSPRLGIGATGMRHDPFPDATQKKQEPDKPWLCPKALLVAQAVAAAETILATENVGGGRVADR
jgi:type 2 lantibiotic biosynthesis protein LanM